MNKFYVDDKSQFARTWPYLTLLFIAAILAWWQVSSLLAAVLAGAGFIFMLISDKRSKKKGSFLEILEKGIIFNEGDQSFSISFAEIKKVKYSKSGDVPTITIETGITKKKIQLSDYDHSNKLLQQLEEKFTLFNCPIVK